MSSMLDYIEQNPHETQRLLGLSYNQLKQLFTPSPQTTNRWSK